MVGVICWPPYSGPACEKHISDKVWSQCVSDHHG